MACDHETNYSREIISIFKEYPSVVFEFKTKSANIKNIVNVSQVLKNIVVSWSLNPEAIVAVEEPGTPTLAKRLKALDRVQSIGYKIGIHLDPIIEIENRSFPSPWSQSAFIQEIENPISHIWALMEDKRLVGYICFWLFDREIQLINIAVHPEHRGKGLGLLLMTRMIETGLSKGSQYIWLEVRISNLSAKHLYHRLGFEEIGRRRGYYRETKEDAIVMVLSLHQKESVRRMSN